MNRKVWGTRLILKPCPEHCGFCFFHVLSSIKRTLLVRPTGRYTCSQNPKLRPFKLNKLKEQQHMQTQKECAVAKECYRIQSYCCYNEQNAKSKLFLKCKCKCAQCQHINNIAVIHLKLQNSKYKPNVN